MSPGISVTAYSVVTMRILHTSDWHLGRGFHGAPLREEQSQMLATVCAEAAEHSADVVLVSGDVYDRALPPEWAVKQLEDCLLQLVQAGVQVIITSGNHDSAQRLGFGRGLMAASGVHIRSSLQDAWDPVELDDDDGGTVLVYGIPYLEPQLYAGALELERANHTAVITEVTRRIREHAEARTAELAGPVRTVLMAHLFAAHGIASESERSIGAAATPEQPLEHHEETLGGLAVVPLEVFSGFDYVALGHLHGRQRLSPRVRYSGAPLRYSFSEENQAKGAWLVETSRLAEDPDAAIAALDWRIGRPVKRLRGPLSQMLDPAVIEQWTEAFVQITLTDDERPERAYPRLREVYPHLMSYSYAGAAATGTHATYSQKLREAESEYDVVSGFLTHVRHRAPSEEETLILQQALEDVRSAEHQPPPREGGA